MLTLYKFHYFIIDLRILKALTLEYENPDLFLLLFTGPVNVTAYARYELPSAMGHMLWPHNCIGP